MLFRFFLLLSLYNTLYGVENILRVGENQTCMYRVETLLNTSFKSYPSIQASRYGIQGANAQVEGAKWGYFPTPSVDVSQASGRRTTTARLDQPLWTFGKLDAAYDIALSRQKESELIFDESSYQLAENLLRVLHHYVQADGTIHALEDGKKQLESLQEMLGRRIEAGVSSLADRELIKSRLAQITADLTVARSKRQMAASQLELLISAPLECGIEFSNPSILRQDIPIDQMIAKMLATHPTIKKLFAQIKTAEAERAKAKAAPWPNVSLRAEHQNGSLYFDQTNSNNQVYVSLQASPGAGLSSLSNIQSAEARVLQLQAEKLTKERELSDAMMLDYQEYRAGIERMEGMSKTIESSKNVLESFTRLFVAGKRQWLDLVNSSRELTQNQISMADIKASYVVSAYRLALKNGMIEFDSGENK